MAHSDPDVLTVSQLTGQVRGLLEGEFPSVWVEGEISNYTAHGSGHWYFTLKDDGASISAAMFRGVNQRVQFRPEHGMAVLCHGRISVYPPRGNYQLIVDRLEPRGAGALQMAFEQLKTKLAAEGLFDADRKRPLPFLPTRIGLVTSPTGAAIRDMLRVLGQRYRPLEILFAPARVQGEGAAAEIAAALGLLQDDGRAQVILCGRGGGSLEDLWPFNTEVVARAIAACSIPVISAVGHEVDTTIADLVADVRAATPSNAAEIAVPVRAELDALLDALDDRLGAAATRLHHHRAERLAATRARLIDPRRHLQIQAQRLDELDGRLAVATGRLARGKADRLTAAERSLAAVAPHRTLPQARRQLAQLDERLQRAPRHQLQVLGGSLGQLAGRLDALSPLGVLGRGYAIALIDRRGSSGSATPTPATPTPATTDPGTTTPGTTAPGTTAPGTTTLGAVRDATEVAPGDHLRLRLHRGQLDCTVDRVHPHQEQEQEDG